MNKNKKKRVGSKNLVKKKSINLTKIKLGNFNFILFYFFVYMHTHIKCIRICQVNNILRKRHENKLLISSLKEENKTKKIIEERVHTGSSWVISFLLLLFFIINYECIFSLLLPHVYIYIFGTSAHSLLLIVHLFFPSMYVQNEIKKN
jgi:hypothetical protein